MTDAKHKQEFLKRDCHIRKDRANESSKGCVTKCVGSEMPKAAKKHGSYRRNGYNTISGDTTKSDIYNRAFTAGEFKELASHKEVPWGTKKRKRARSDPSKKPDSWKIGKAYPRNFLYAHTPYNHDYHHIMPMDCLLGLEPAHVKQLMKAEYNLNAGINLIILPRGEYYARKVRLPYHASNHPQYIGSIASQLSKLDESLQKADAAHKESIAKGAKDLLEKWEVLTFSELCVWGAAQVKQNDAAPDINEAAISPIGFA